MQQYLKDISAGIGLAVIFLILGIFFFPFLILVPFALIAGLVTPLARKLYQLLK